MPRSTARSQSEVPLTGYTRSMHRRRHPLLLGSSILALAGSSSCARRQVIAPPATPTLPASLRVEALTDEPSAAGFELLSTRTQGPGFEDAWPRS